MASHEPPASYTPPGGFQESRAFVYDGTIWFYVYDAWTCTSSYARAVCVVALDAFPERNAPTALPGLVSNDPTEVPTHAINGRPLPMLRWATQDDLHPAYRD